jgi:hypothetical protein
MALCLTPRISNFATIFLEFHSDRVAYADLSVAALAKEDTPIHRYADTPIQGRFGCGYATRSDRMSGVATFR